MNPENDTAVALVKVVSVSSGVPISSEAAYKYSLSNASSIELIVPKVPVNCTLETFKSLTEEAVILPLNNNTPFLFST